MEKETSANSPKKINPRNTNVGWGAKAAIWVTILAYVLSQVIVIIPFGIFYLSSNEAKAETLLEDNLWVNFSLMALSAVTLITVLYVFLKKRKLGFKSLGFKKIKKRDLGYIVLFGIAYLTISAALIALAGFVPGFDGSQEQDIGFSNAAGWQLAVVFFSLVIIPPLAEEMIFRGFFYRGLSRGWLTVPVLTSGIFMAGMAAIFSGNIFAGLAILAVTIISLLVAKKNILLASAIFVSSIFGLVHAQWNVAIDTFALSIMLIALYEKTKNLWACVGLHALKNLIAFMVLFIVGK